MRLISFSLKNYRSISTAYKLPLTDYIVIVGPNNEGKSNILKGLGLAISMLSGSRPTRYRRRGYRYNYDQSHVPFDYDWERDFPINLQKSDFNGKSEFICEFELNENELAEFKKIIKINLTTTLKAKILIGKDDIVKFDFLMKGKAKQSLNKKRLEITKFINDKLLLQYIPAIRTSELAINIVESLLEGELSKLEEKQEFQDIVKKINKLQQPIIDEISNTLKNTINSFVPDVKNIKIKNRENVGRLISSSCQVYVDDGIETDLLFKGDGIISLTAISLLQHFSKQGSLNKSLILLLEEPESHLHPKAIHNLKNVLLEISKSNQVIVTTHSPIMVERLGINHNIIVEKRKATPASSIDDIRKSLGITMADNLSSAFLVLLVEGIEDITILSSWLTDKSLKIKSAIENATLIIDNLGGATNVGYKASLYKNNLCNVIAYLDNDDCGRNSITEALSKGIIKENEYVLTSVRMMQNCELEDLINFNVYNKIIWDDYGIELNSSPFKNRRKKWSDRVKELFQLGGKIWTDALEREIKYKVANEAAKLKINSLNIHKASSIDNLVRMIESIIDNLKI